MSQILNVITTEFRARGNQAVAQMGSIAQGFGSITKAANETSRMSERLNNQWRAIGTTIRYAVAGGAIFGLRSVVAQFGEIQKQLGLISAIGTTSSGGVGNQMIVGNDLDRMAAQLRGVAVKTITPINEINDAAINFFSTVQNAPKDQVSPILERISKAAVLSQVTSEDATKALTTMNIAFGRPNNLKNISDTAQMLFNITTLAPGGRAAGGQIIQQIGPLSSLFALGKGKGVTGQQGQQQMMSMILASLRFGGTPSTSIRGLQYFVQSLVQPASPAARRALGGIGINPQFIEKHGVYAAAMKFLQHIAPGSKGANSKQLNSLDDEALSNIDENAGSLPGIPADQMKFLRTALGRIHGIRAAITLSQQLQQHGDVQSLSQDVDIMSGNIDQITKDTLDMDKAWTRFAQRAKLQQASVAINAMTQQVATAFAPLFNFVGGHTVGVQQSMARHPKLTRDIALGTGIGLASLGIGRFLGLGAGLGKGLTGANAALAAGTGGGGQTVMTGLGNSPANPMYVVVVTQLFNGRSQGGLIVHEGEKVPGGKPPGKFGKFGRVFGGVAAGIGIGYVADQALQDASARQKRDGWGKFILGDLAGPLGFGKKKHAWSGGSLTDMMNAVQAEKVMNKYSPNHPAEISKVFKTMFEKINGKAYVTLDVNLQYPGGKVEKKRVHIPLDLWGDTGTVPTAKGGRKTNR